MVGPNKVGDLFENISAFASKLIQLANFLHLYPHRRIPVSQPS